MKLRLRRAKNAKSKVKPSDSFNGLNELRVSSPDLTSGRKKLIFFSLLLKTGNALDSLNLFFYRIAVCVLLYSLPSCDCHFLAFGALKALIVPLLPFPPSFV